MMRMLVVIVLVLLPVIQAHGQAPAAADIEQGAKNWQGFFGFQNDCKLCHGERGEGGFASALAGHRLSDAQFLAAVREGRGTSMPAFAPDKNMNDQQIAQIRAYLASLPRPVQPSTMWRTPVPPLATPAQKLYITSGCGQCHAQIFANPRRTAGGLGGDWEWFKTATYEHTTAPEFATRSHLRMGNYTRQQVPEATLREIWHFFAVEQGLRVPMSASVSEGVRSANGMTYTITVQNTGTPGKGLTAEYVTVTLPLMRGRDPEEVTSVVVSTTGGGYMGIQRDPITNSNAAIFEIPRLGPRETHTLTITLTGPGSDRGIPRGMLKWERPLLPSGATDMIAIAVPLGQ
jgi:mono/diheme cytochrome c family protein